MTWEKLGWIILYVRIQTPSHVYNRKLYNNITNFISLQTLRLPCDSGNPCDIRAYLYVYVYIYIPTPIIGHGNFLFLYPRPPKIFCRFFFLRFRNHDQSEPLYDPMSCAYYFYLFIFIIILYSCYIILRQPSGDLQRSWGREGRFLYRGYLRSCKRFTIYLGPRRCRSPRITHIPTYIFFFFLSRSFYTRTGPIRKPSNNTVMRAPYTTSTTTKFHRHRKPPRKTRVYGIFLRYSGPPSTCTRNPLLKTLRVAYIKVKRKPDIDKFTTHSGRIII